MKRKDLLLTTLLLTQAAPVWGMDFSQLSDEIEKVRTGVQKTASQYQSQESVVILGPTGSGKTTLINLLAGRSFKAEQNTTGFKRLKPVCTNPLPDSNISGTNKVGTSIPFGWKDNNGVIFWDCPGFGDPRGPEKDIVNAVAIHELFKGNTKFLLLAEESFLGDTRSTKFLSLLKEATDILTNDKQLEQSLSIVVTKQEKLDDPYKFIKTDILSLSEADQPLLTSRIRKFLEHLVNPNTPKRISLLPSPTLLGTYVPDLTFIKKSIQATIASNNPDTQLVVSDKAKILVGQYAQTLDTEISNLIKNEGSQLSVDYCNNKMKNHKNIAEKLRINMKEAESHLNDFKNELLQISNAPVNLNTLLTPHLTDLLPMISLKEKLETFSFLKNIEKTINYNGKAWAHSCSTVIDKVHPLTLAPDVQTNQDTLTLKGVFIGISDIVKALQNRKNIHRVDTFSLNTVFIDEDINSPGMSLSLVAPCAKVIGNKTINLNGTTGSKGTNGLWGRYASASGTDGLPGVPGKHGGSIFWKGVTFADFNCLIISLNGGMGGHGGNGGDGQDGVNGDDGDLEVTRQEKYSHIELTPDSHPSYTWTRSTRGTREYYENCGTPGSAGGHGGKGGKGGLGGNKGAFESIGFSTSVLRQFSSLNGKNGNDGNGGTGGEAGQDGRDCQGIKLTNLIQSYKVDSYICPYGWNNIGYDDRRIADEIEMPIKHKKRRGLCSGNSGVGLNTTGQQNPPVQIVLKGHDILSLYRTYYKSATTNPNITVFVRPFPNL